MLVLRCAQGLTSVGEHTGPVPTLTLLRTARSSHSDMFRATTVEVKGRKLFWKFLVLLNIMIEQSPFVEFKKSCSLLHGIHGGNAFMRPSCNPQRPRIIPRIAWILSLFLQIGNLGVLPCLPFYNLSNSTNAPSELSDKRSCVQMFTRHRSFHIKRSDSKSFLSFLSLVLHLLRTIAILLALLILTFSFSTTSLKKSSCIFSLTPYLYT